MCSCLQILFIFSPFLCFKSQLQNHFQDTKNFLGSFDCKVGKWQEKQLILMGSWKWRWVIWWEEQSIKFICKWILKNKNYAHTSHVPLNLLFFEAETHFGSYLKLSYFFFHFWPCGLLFHKNSLYYSEQRDSNYLICNCSSIILSHFIIYLIFSYIFKLIISEMHMHHVCTKS